VGLNDVLNMRRFHTGPDLHRFHMGPDLHRDLILFIWTRPV
jgi:hypothetical protein